ncbi:hypothetical protein N0V88_005716 [Collariella sp. IMI 366227]|nr:hypothetical protein N0V88_005716 [Collariella sp. IMI 366227]
MVREITIGSPPQKVCQNNASPTNPIPAGSSNPPPPTPSPPNQAISSKSISAAPPPPKSKAANCTVVTDKISMGGALNDAGFEFLAYHTFSSGLRNHDPDGIFDEHKKRDGVLTLGRRDEKLYKKNSFKTIPLNWPLSKSHFRWVIDIQNGTINGTPIQNATDTVALIDTGTSIIIMPDTKTAKEIYNHFRNQIIPLDDFDIHRRQCDQKHSRCVGREVYQRGAVSGPGKQ